MQQERGRTSRGKTRGMGKTTGTGKRQAARGKTARGKTVRSKTEQEGVRAARHKRQDSLGAQFARWLGIVVVRVC
jgi:hypothetical protein